MRPLGVPQSKKYQDKATVRKIVWWVVLLFAVYSAYAILRPLVIMYLFEHETDKICDEKRLMDRELDFNPIVAEIKTEAAGWEQQGLKMAKGGVTHRSDGGINHLTITYTTEGSWCGVPMHYNWETKYMSAKKRTGY
ncbi:MAG: hypothetical protein JW759_03660 [Candidatus Coatesbacteria bacterium]|nr:hypothetical protein [Candidatus Coatesbacteria bacterium]